MVRSYSSRDPLVNMGDQHRNAVDMAKQLVAKGDRYRAETSAPAKPTTGRQRAKPDPAIVLKKSLAKYTKSNDRQMMVRSLESSKLFRNIQLEGLDCANFPVHDESAWLKLEEEVSHTKIILNGIRLGGESDSKIREMFVVLEKLCEALTSDLDLTTEQLFQAMILRSAQSIASNDAYFHLNALLGSPDLMLLPSKGGLALPTKLDVYTADDCLHLVCETAHSYGLFRKVDLSTHAKQPWISLVATVHKRTNLTTNESVRYLSVKVAEKLGFV